MKSTSFHPYVTNSFSSPQIGQEISLNSLIITNMPAMIAQQAVQRILSSQSPTSSPIEILTSDSMIWLPVYSTDTSSLTYHAGWISSIADLDNNSTATGLSKGNVLIKINLEDGLSDVQMTLDHAWNVLKTSGHTLAAATALPSSTKKWYAPLLRDLIDPRGLGDLVKLMNINEPNGEPDHRRCFPITFADSGGTTAAVMLPQSRTLFKRDSPQAYSIRWQGNRWSVPSTSSQALAYSLKLVLPCRYRSTPSKIKGCVSFVSTSATAQNHSSHSLDQSRKP